MVRHTGIFIQVVSLFNRNEFPRILKKYGGEKHSKGFTCWGDFVSMPFCQFGPAKSLREICDGLLSSAGKLKYLGLKGAPKRPWKMYRDLFYQTILSLDNYNLGNIQRQVANRIVF